VRWSWMNSEMVACQPVNKNHVHDDIGHFEMINTIEWGLAARDD